MLIFQFSEKGFTPEQMQTYSFLKSLEDHPLSEIELKKEARAVFEEVARSNEWPMTVSVSPLERIAAFCNAADGKIMLNEEGAAVLEEYKQYIPDGAKAMHLWV